MQIDRRTALAGLSALSLSGCITGPLPTFGSMNPFPPLADVERRTGGRLGVALVDSKGMLLAGHRTDERFAICSTFKLLLAAMVYDRYDSGGPSLREPITFTRADLVYYAPVTEPMLEGRESAEIRLGEAVGAMVEVSDNVAANLVLKQMGGPEGFTAWLRGIGDMVTRLDRMETALNENAVGDPRDTSTPAAIAESARKALLGEVIQPAFREQLIGHLVASTTGQKRLRAGVPADWRVGDKTGTGGSDAPTYNDLAIIFPPGREPAILAAYLDRPTVDAAEANAALAEVGAIAANLLV